MAEIAPKELRGRLMVSSQAKIGRIKEFEIALQRFRGKDADIHDEAMEILVGIGLMALAHLNGATAILYYASDIFVSAGFSSGDLGTIVLAAMQLLITVAKLSL
ncbi:hypothetical protein EJ110_NYTH21793 [Nymphaea thermarum]|nr:hypothetical protein EJ110_NYTH21793 [Nymphaea thermarum]